METENRAIDMVPRLRLYSAGGIKLLSLLFTTIAGGVMTSQNLKDANQHKEARIALWGSIGYTVVMIFLTAQLPKSPASPWLSWPIGLIGGLFLEAYFRRFVPTWNSIPAKSNFKPFCICLLITGVLLACVFYPLLNQ